MTIATLDDSVFAAAEALEGRGVTPPQIAFLLGTGVGTLPAGLRRAQRIPLEGLAGVPPAWQSVELHAGELGDTSVWLIEDAPDDLECGEAGGPAAPGWERGFPCWLAVASGATVGVHTSAGIALGAEGGDSLPVGSLAILSDHINVSGQTPLVGLGSTRLGPLFPDQSYLHHAALRQHALDHAQRRGIACREAIAACTLGPTQCTPAELRWLTSTGADVAVQGLAGPLLASAHAGLALLAIVAVIDDGKGRQGTLRLGDLIERAEACAPALEDLLGALLPDLSAVARSLAEEMG